MTLPLMAPPEHVIPLRQRMQRSARVVAEWTLYVVLTLVLAELILG